MFEPLVVRAELMAPVMFDRWQPLDGVLGAAIIEDPELRQRSRRQRTCRRILADRGLEAAKAHFERKGWELPETREHFVPLAVWGHGMAHGLWVYCSSWAMPEAYERDLVHFTKRVNFEQVERYVETEDRRVYTAKGEFAAKYLPFQTMVTAGLAWYVRGDRAAIEEILPVVRSIGKKRRRGYGVVRRWTVDGMEEDRSVFAPDGALMRPVPATLLEAMEVSGEFEYAFTTYRPPYWDGRYAVRCAVGGYSVVAQEPQIGPNDNGRYLPATKPI